MRNLFPKFAVEKNLAFSGSACLKESVKTWPMPEVNKQAKHSYLAVGTNILCISNRNFKKQSTYSRIQEEKHRKKIKD